jgi:predicted O-linked N-acetylglucosamine transferase (SPINDLY family)
MNKIMKNPGNTVNWAHVAQTHIKAGRWAEAVDCLNQAVRITPDRAEPFYYLGLALQHLGRVDEAISCYKRAAGLNPLLAEAFNNLGNLYLAQAKLDEAAASYRQALKIRPALVQAHYNLGLTLKKQGNIPASVQKFIDTLECDPENVFAFDNALNGCYWLGWIEKRVELFLRYEKTIRPSIELYLAGLTHSRYLGDPERERLYLEKVLTYPYRAGEEGKLSEAIGRIQYFDVPQARIFALYKKFDTLMSASYRSPFPLVWPRRTRGARVRVGYLSPDFRQHVMGKLMLEVLSRHDNSMFEIYCYSLLPEKNEDDLTRTFRALSHKFVAVEPFSPFDTAKLIAEDDLDILVDLGAHSTSSKPAILGFKPARIQATHLGYHGSVGLKTVDYKLTDRFADTPENQQYLLEKLLPLDGCVFPFKHIAPADQPLTRKMLGIPKDAVVFGAFAYIMKFSPRQMDAWRKILEQVEGSVLAFSPYYEDEKKSLLRQAALMGIPPERVAFVPASRDDAINRARYRVVDVVLDTFPYGGGDTTLAALDMGVPVVTLVGQRHSERASYSILMNLGVQGSIAASEAEYIEIACHLALDKVARKKIKGEIQRGLKNSTLVDISGYVRNLEAAYTRALEEKNVSLDTCCPLSAQELSSLFRKAIGAHQTGNITEAEGVYREVLDAQPDYAPALFLHGRLLIERGENAQAEASIKKALAIYPDYADARRELANLYRKQGRGKEAGKLLASVGP